MSAQVHYDVLIIGGGMVGATLACALAEQPLQVGLIDPAAQPATVPTDTFDLRVSAITRASQRVFMALGVWDTMTSRRVSPFREMHVWESERHALHFDSADLSEPYLGHIIENSVITASLYERLTQQDNLRLWLGQSCQRLERSDDTWRVHLADGTHISADLLVGADGSRSWLRQQLGITVRGWDYAQAALVTYVKTQQSHQETAWQRFLPQGPLAFLPLTDGYSSIVWSTAPEHAAQLCQLEAAQFAQELESAFESRLGAITEVGPRATFPLRFLMAEQYVQHGMALVGDAAHTIHPLAGQGVNLGLLDAAALAEVISAATVARRDIASLQTLRRYERWRKAENMSMLVMVDQLQRLYGLQQPAWRWLRDTGMGLINSLAPVKHELIEHAMGNRGDLPRLARGN